MRNISATYKGVIFGCLMIISSLVIYATLGNFDNSFQYFTYALYVAAIVWTLRDFKKQHPEKKKFKDFFSEGFKCFIVIVFLMVAFTFIFLKLNPGLKDQMAISYTAELKSKGNYTPNEVVTMVNNARTYFDTLLISMAIFGYLVIGAMVTIVTSLFLMKTKNVQ